MSLLVLLTTLLLSAQWFDTTLSFRACERDNTCKYCGSNYYSFIRCKISEACSLQDAQYCLEGFCCPGDSHRQPPRDARMCPNGLFTTRLCAFDQHCMAQQLCIDGRCCDDCRTWRYNQMTYGKGLLMDTFVPSCIGRYFASRQCWKGSCWCQTRYGKRLNSYVISPKDPQGDKYCWKVQKRSADDIRKGHFILSTYSRGWVQDEHAKWNNRIQPLADYALSVADGCSYKRPYRCPRVNAREERYGTVHDCQCDSDCSNRMHRCCPTDRGRRCVEGLLADQRKPGRCPVFYKENLFDTLCQHDLQCSADQKCCAVSYGHRCVKPILPSKLSCDRNEGKVFCFNPCQPHCQQPHRSPCRTDVCQEGCHCRVGFVRRTSNARSECVPRWQCSN